MDFHIFDHRNTNKLLTSSKQYFVGFKPLLGQWVYVLSEHFLLPSLTHIISQMHWIVTNFEHRNTNQSY
ncbi:hypothetical protein AtNW77_Chr1g0042061 [Arabidopsis thaliana]